MKKIYIKPLTEKYKVHSTALLVGSIPGGEQGGAGDHDDTKGSTGPHIDWEIDDEEEEED